MGNLVVDTVHIAVVAWVVFGSLRVDEAFRLLSLLLGLLCYHLCSRLYLLSVLDSCLFVGTHLDSFGYMGLLEELHPSGFVAEGSQD